LSGTFALVKSCAAHKRILQADVSEEGT
jgi:hypothetical protein